MRKFLTAAIFTLFAGSALAQTSGPIGDAMPSTGYLNFVYSGAFNLFYEGTTYRRWTGETYDSALSVSTAPVVISLGAFYNGSWSQYWQGSAAGADGVSNTTPAPWVANLSYGFNGTTWDRLRTITTQADAQAAGTRGLVTSSFLYGYNGTTFDMLRIGASNELQVVDVSNRAGEDVGNDWRKIKVEAIATDSPAATTAVAIPGTSTLTVVLAGYEVLGFHNVCAYLKNTSGAGQAFNDAEVYASPNNSDWVALSWTSADSLADGATAVWCVSNNAYRYIQVKAAAAGATTASGWFTMNK